MIAIIIGLVLIVARFILSWNEVSGLDILSTMLGTAIFVGGMQLIEPKPQAIDVYRGKTTLQITYKDSIPIDTIVVWK